MNAKPYFKKTNKCKNEMPFGKNNSKKFLEILMNGTGKSLRKF
jgi:hypothetical protein